MNPIQINGSQYFFVSSIWDDGSCTTFYKKGTPLKVKKITRKYWLFGPVIKEEMVEKENIIFCFRINRPIINRLDDNFIAEIKEAEEKYKIKDKLLNGNIEI